MNSSASLGIKVAAHILDAFFGRLHYPVEVFPNRAKTHGHGWHVILPDACDGDPHLDWLQSLELGPREGFVHRIPGVDMAAGIREDEVLRGLLKQASVIELFSPSQIDVDMADNLGLNWDSQIWGCPPQLAATLGDKIELRKLVNQWHNKGEVNWPFLEYDVCSVDTDEIWAAAQRLGGGMMIVKAPAKASGHGQVCFDVSNWSHRLRVERLVHDLVMDGCERVFVEPALIEADDFSCSVTFRCLGEKGVTPIHISYQNVEIGQNGEILWHGNIVATGVDLPRIDSEAAKRLFQFARPYAEKINDLGHRGDLVWDLMYNGHTGDTYILEVNPRVTMSIYARNVLDDVSTNDRYSHNSCAVVMTNVEHVPESVRSWASLRTLLEGNNQLFNWDKERGVIPHLVEMLSCEEYPMCALACVAPTVKEASEISRQATALIMQREPVASRA